MLKQKNPVSFFLSGGLQISDCFLGLTGNVIAQWERPRSPKIKRQAEAEGSAELSPEVTQKPEATQSFDLPWSCVPPEGA